MTATHAGVLHASHRRVHGAPRGGVCLVDVDRARPDPTRDPAAGRGVPGPDARVETVRRGVGSIYRFVHRLEGIDGHDRPEGLLIAQLHLVGYVRENRRLEEVGPDLGAGVAAGEQPRTLGHRVPNVPLDLLELLPGRQRPDVHAVVQSRSQSQAAGRGGEALEEGLRDRGLHVEALEGDAELAGVGERAPHGTPCSGIQVSVRQHEHRVLAAELQAEADEALPGPTGHDPAHCRAPCE